MAPRVASFSRRSLALLRLARFRALHLSLSLTPSSSSHLHLGVARVFEWVRGCVDETESHFWVFHFFGLAKTASARCFNEHRHRSPLPNKAVPQTCTDQVEENAEKDPSTWMSAILSHYCFDTRSLRTLARSASTLSGHSFFNIF